MEERIEVRKHATYLSSSSPEKVREDGEGGAAARWAGRDASIEGYRGRCRVGESSTEAAAATSLIGAPGGAAARGGGRRCGGRERNWEIRI